MPPSSPSLCGGLEHVFGHAVFISLISALFRGSEHMLVFESHSGWNKGALDAKLLPAVLVLLVKAQMF